MSNQHVDLYVDPACPWCWLTALWLFEVERVRPISVTTRLFSLAEVNKEKPRSRGAGHRLVRALRVMVAARRAGGEQAVRGLYLALGDAHHERGRAFGDAALLHDALRPPASTPASPSRRWTTTAPSPSSSTSTARSSSAAPSGCPR